MEKIDKEIKKKTHIERKDIMKNKKLIEWKIINIKINKIRANSVQMSNNAIEIEIAHKKIKDMMMMVEKIKIEREKKIENEKEIKISKEEKKIMMMEEINMIKKIKNLQKEKMVEDKKVKTDQNQDLEVVRKKKPTTQLIRIKEIRSSIKKLIP